MRIASTQELVLAPIVGAQTFLQIATQSLAAIGGAGPMACVVALDSRQSGITLSGGTSLSAPDCSIASNASLFLPCGTRIIAEAVHYGTNPPQEGCGGISAPDGSTDNVTRLTTEDPLAHNANIRGAAARLASHVRALPPVPGPGTSGPDIVLNYGPRAPVAAQLKQTGCSLGSGSDYSGQWTILCTGNGPFKFGSITVESNVSATFPGGTYEIARGLVVSDKSVVSFGRGIYRVGLAASCGHSICVINGSRLNIAGPSDFILPAGLMSGGDAHVTLGGGEDNFFDLGAGSSGDAINLGGGSLTFMGDASTRPNAFRVRGNIRGGGGGSCFAIPRAPHHDIAGSIMVDGATILGAGVYTVDGAFLLGAGSGGSADCWGRHVSVEAIGVSVIISGKTSVSAGYCANTSFCISAGYRNVVFQAPTSGSTAGLAVIGPIDGRTNGASLSEGAENARISGAFYFPTGPIEMSGGAGLGGGSGDCLQLIGSRITLSGGASAASNCFASSGGGKSGRIVLVQ